MRLQNLTIIFIVIALPVIIILSVFVKYQIDTANLRASYDNKFVGATYDMLQAFQLNTTNNKYSAVSDSLVRDIEASVNIFSRSFSSSLGIAGQSKTEMMLHVPAILFTLYDGYYIYTPTRSEDNTKYEHALKPYIYYTNEYNVVNAAGSKVGKIIINYSLDNYVAVYYSGDGSYQSKAGYLEFSVDNSSVNASNRNVGIYIDGSYDNSSGKYTNVNHIEYKGVTIDDDTAYKYYKEAAEFTKWYNNLIGGLNLEKKNANLSYRDILKITKENLALPGENSEFNGEKVEVIENIITNHLKQTLQTYRNKMGVNYDFNMPVFTPYDWNKILNNVCVISFMQGYPVGTATYNNYVIIPSTENKQYVSEKGIYYIGSGGTGSNKADNSYHRLGCEHLKGDTIVGYNKIEFQRQTRLDPSGSVAVDSNGNTRYTYLHPEMACYYCIVNASDASKAALDNEYKNPDGTNKIGKNQDEYNRKIKAYYTALAREKYNLSKLSEYVNGSGQQN